MPSDEFFVNQSIEGCVPVVYRFTVNANQLYCTVVLYRRPAVVRFAVRLCWVLLTLAGSCRLVLALAGSCWLLLSEASYTAVPCVHGDKRDRTDEATLAPFTLTGPSLAWSPHIRIPSAPTNRNIRLKVIPK